jgi:hypothetical protein
MLEDDEEKEIGARKQIDTPLLRQCIKTQMWILLFQRLKHLRVMNQM